MRLGRLMQLALTVLCVLGVQQTASSDTMVAGGAELNANLPNYSSEKIPLGGTPSEHTFEFRFVARFPVCGVTVRMEDEKGAEIQASPSQGITRIRVVYGDPPTSHGSTDINPPRARGRHDGPPMPISPHLPIWVQVKAKATVTVVRFSLAFSSQPITISKGCSRLADFRARGGNPTIARPFLPMTTGLLLCITNGGKSPIAFGRFELMGAQPGIDEVIVPDKAFDITFDGNNAFTLTGDRIEPQQTIQVYIVFDGKASEAGALVARFTRF